VTGNPQISRFPSASRTIRYDGGTLDLGQGYSRIAGQCAFRGGKWNNQKCRSRRSAPRFERVWVGPGPL
jgi:hypothetical protein